MSKIISKDTKYKGVIFDLEKRKIELDDGQVIDRELIIKNEVVTVLTIHRTRKTVILTKEYRSGINETTLGFPAGILDNTDKNPEFGALRELREETGYSPIHSEYLGVGNVSAGFTNERCHYYVTLVDGKPENQTLDEGEQIKIVEIPLGSLVEYVNSGKIQGEHAQSCLLRLILKQNKDIELDSIL